MSVRSRNLSKQKTDNGLDAQKSAILNSHFIEAWTEELISRKHCCQEAPDIRPVF